MSRGGGEVGRADEYGIHAEDRRDVAQRLKSLDLHGAFP
jgi:hypothetical protein